MRMTPRFEDECPVALRQPLQLGVIGAGNIWRKAHAPAIEALRAAGWPVEVVAIADPKAAARSLARATYPQAECFDDGAALLSRAACDAVLILTWPPQTEELAELALAHRVPVFVEKPVAHHARDLQHLSAWADEVSIPITVGYNRRYQPWVKEFQEQLGGAAPQHIAVRLWRARRAEAEFYEDVLGHPLDFLRYCLGEMKLTRVRAWPPLETSAIHAGLQVEMVTERGSTVDLDVRPAVGRHLESYEALLPQREIYFSYAPVEEYFDAARLAVFSGGQREILCELTEEASAAELLHARGFVRQMAAFLRLVAVPGSLNQCTLSDALAAQKLMQEILCRAAEQSRTASPC